MNIHQRGASSVCGTEEVDGTGAIAVWWEVAVADEVVAVVVDRADWEGRVLSARESDCPSWSSSSGEGGSSRAHANARVERSVFLVNKINYRLKKDIRGEVTIGGRMPEET